MNHLIAPGIDHVTQHPPLISSNYHSVSLEISVVISHILSRTNGSARNFCVGSSYRLRTPKSANSAPKRSSSFDASIVDG
jgi:hypothetical protein